MVVFYAVAAFLLSCGLCPLIIKFCNKKQLFDEVDPRKIHTGNIPRLGGVAVFCSFVLVSVVCHYFVDDFSFSEYWQVAVAMLIVYFTGLVDDILDLPARLKFVLQILAAGIIAFSPFYFRTFLSFSIPPVLGRIGIFLWILVCINAYNLIDGLDWLCSGLSVISVLTFAACGLIKKWDYYPFLFVLAGSIAGFMVWNKPNAKIFLGDSGSTTLGFLIAVIPVLNPADKIYEYNQILTCLLVSAIPTIDVLAAVIRRTRDKRSIFSPDRAHLHHKLLNIGFSKITILVCILSMQCFIAFMIIASMFTGRRIGMAFIISAYAVICGVFILIHYVNRNVNLMHKGLLKDNPQSEHRLMGGGDLPNEF